MKKEYKIVVCKYTNELESAVNKMLSSGWICQGGISEASSGAYTVSQAMYREVESKASEVE